MTSSELNVLINQQPYQLPVGSRLLDAIERLGIQPPFAAAVNLEFVPRGQYAHRLLQDGDQIELIAPITGG
ncbi:MAG: thiamine biosynthesis protein ThiS [Pseudomonadota bacterium]|jgi:sulfur carrier protein